MALIVLRNKNAWGPVAQPMGNGRVVHGPGNAFGPGGANAGLRATRAEIGPDADHITVYFNTCSTLHPLHAGVEYQVDGGSWLTVAGETSAGDGTEHTFTLHLPADEGQVFRWRYVPGQATPGLVDCADGEEMEAVEIPVWNPIEILDPAWTPLNLFAAGEQGAWYDPSDLSTMFQDSAGTIPVTAVGQPVGRILDKSGNAKHATQATAAARPLLQQDANLNYYLAFDGVDDSLATPVINYSAVNKISTFCGISKNSDATTGGVANQNYVNSGSFAIRAPDASGINSYAAAQRGSVSGSNERAIVSGYTAPITNVFTGQHDLLTPRLITRIDADDETIDTDANSGFFSNASVHIGQFSNGSLRFSGRIYSLIIRSGLSTATEIDETEAWVADKTGVTLP